MNPPFVFPATQTKRVEAMVGNAPRLYRMPIIFDLVADLRRAEGFYSEVSPIKRKLLQLSQHTNIIAT